VIAERPRAAQRGDAVRDREGRPLRGQLRRHALPPRPRQDADEVSIDRTQVGGGWFVTPLIVLKGEWVNQRYTDFPTTDIRNGGRFKGFVVEGVVAF
jgi:hypothetical protein